MRYTPRAAAANPSQDIGWYEVDVIEPGTVSTRPVRVDKGEFQRALPKLVRDVRLEEPPREAARAVLNVGVEEDWVLEVYRGKVLTLAPEEERSVLTSREAEALVSEYHAWCEGWGGGDCLSLQEDGPYLRTEDRRTLALALALDSVLEESREALAREFLDPRAVLATLVWTAAMYLAMWLVPEPVTKGVAAVLTLAMMAWLGVDALWGVIDGWAKLAHQAHEARSFGELRAAGKQYAKVLGEHTARALVMGVAAVVGSKGAEVARRVRELPGHARAAAQAEAQGVRLEALAEVESVAASVEGSFTVVRRGGRGAGSAAPGRPGGPFIVRVLQHKGGNMQVVLSNGQRWHLPRGMTPDDIPLSDPPGDELQAATSWIAKRWSKSELTREEAAAIDKALKGGKFYQAARLEGQARGRWVEAQLREQFRHLKWNRQGVDVTSPSGERHHYEVLSGTEDNFARHGRRMPDVFFRMIFF